MRTFLILFQGGGVSGLAQFLPLLLIIVVFYFLVLRPQQRRQKQLQETISALKVSDKVITTGGIIGVIAAVRESSFIIRSADKTVLEIARTAIADIDREGKEAS